MDSCGPGRGAERRRVFYRSLGEGLIAFAERHFELGARDKDGATLEQSLRALLERVRSDEKRAEIEAQLARPPLPAGTEHIWSAFARLHGRRGGAGFGPSPITWLDIDAFLRLTKQRLEPWEIALIEKLDGVYLAEQSKQSAGAGGHSSG